MDGHRLGLCEQKAGERLPGAVPGVAVYPDRNPFTF